MEATQQGVSAHSGAFLRAINSDPALGREDQGFAVQSPNDVVFFHRPREGTVRSLSSWLDDQLRNPRRSALPPTLHPLLARHVTSEFDSSSSWYQGTFRMVSIAEPSHDVYFFP